MKKILALVLALAMVALCAVALAAPTTNNKLTISDSRTGRSYAAYQILTGDISGSEGAVGAAGYTLANIAWGSGVSKVGENEVTTGTLLTADELAALPGAAASRDTIEAYVESLTLKGTGTASSAVSGGYEITGLTSGWYLIKETTAADGTDSYVSAFLTEVIGDATAAPKGSTTTVEKKVEDKNDTTNTTEANRDSADYDIGDTITFTLTATLGNNLTDYDTYELIFTDNLSAGLTYGEVTSVKVGATAKQISDVTVADGTWNGSTAAFTGGTVKTFTISDVLALGATGGSVVEIKYTATLNENAVKGTDGNTNKVYLEYSNNPDSNTHGKTGEDKNVVFTYKVDVNKVTGSPATALTGADFTLYKQVPSGTTGAQTGATIKGAYTNASIKADALADANYYVTVGRKTGSAVGSTFDFDGVDDGVYVLVETTIPTGYNAWDAQEFTISATHTDGENPTLTELTGGDLFTANLGEGSLTANVVNNQGTTLPSTGGIGTTIFYIVGGLLVIGAAVILVARRKSHE